MIKLPCQWKSYTFAYIDLDILCNKQVETILIFSRENIRETYKVQAKSSSDWEQSNKS